MVRVNILSDSSVAQKFLEGVVRLKDPQQSPWPGQAGLSIYDFFVYWHFRSMMLFTPPSQNDRNAAHSGPVFLPWHRYMLLRFEQQLEAALNDPEFRLPYWEWTADSELPDPVQSPLWDNDIMGEFVSGSWRVRLLDNSEGGLMLVDRPLQRTLGADGGLARRSDVRPVVLEQTLYDTPPFNSFSQGFRNLVEGWIGSSRIHNNVHVWVGGDMGLATSPNDPVFFLHHCNIDRIWAAWQSQHPTSAQYVPDQGASDDLALHRIDDPMFTLLNEPELITPRSMLDVGTLYRYDSFEDITGSAQTH